MATTLAALAVGCSSEPAIEASRVVATPLATPSPKPKPSAVRKRSAAIGRPTPPAARSSSIWDCIAQKESGGDWSDRHGVYEGGLHFMHDTWIRAGGRKYAEHAYQATRAQQIAIAIAWLARTSWEQWPNTSRLCGVR